MLVYNDSLSYSQLNENYQISDALFLENDLLVKNYSNYQLNTFFKTENKSDYYILNNPPACFLPFLTIKNNVLIEISNKQITEEKLLNILENFQLSPKILQLFPKDITPLEYLKLQIIHGILLHKKAIILGNLEKTISIPEIQSLLPILKQASNEYQITILLLTDDAALLTSSYSDKKQKMM